MEETNCENVRIASMARADGFSTLLSPDQIDGHLATCVECRLELQQLAALTGFLDSAERNKRSEQLWPLIEQRLEGAAAVARKGPVDWRPFLVLGLLLAGYRVIMAAKDQDFGLWFKLVPVALVLTVFVYLNENPFRINSNLRLRGE
jgi:predicted anti-sigma-YlaC factor YlaD